MERIYDKNFKKEFLSMKKGEDWNELRKKYDLSKYLWDDEMNKHFEKLLGKYSNVEDYRKNQLLILEKYKIGACASEQVKWRM